MSAPHHSMAPPAVTANEQPRYPLRLRLRPKALTTGYVDGVWWPRSRDLAAELPALLAVPAVRLGETPQVSNNRLVHCGLLDAGSACTPTTTQGLG
jgi:Family of unknown function (DUF5994)